MKTSFVIPAAAVLWFIWMLVPVKASACGGVTAFIVDDAVLVGMRSARGPGGITFYEDQEGNALLPASAVKVESALAQGIAERYVTTKYGKYGHLEFEGFSYDHGDFVYMYHADVPSLAYSVHVGPVAYVTSHAHIHVSAINGDVYGPGCGLGSGIVDLRFESHAYSRELFGKRLPYRQFDSHFIAREGPPPRIDGTIDPEEWRDAGPTGISVGTSRREVTEYG